MDARSTGELDIQLLYNALLADELPLFSEKRLKIRDVYGKVVPFVFNPEQQYAYRILRLLRDRPFATLLRIFKARKRGMSTMFTGDMFHQFQYSSNRIRNGLIYGHVADSSNTLFEILKRFYDHMPNRDKWELDKDNEKILRYVNGSSIQVKTVGAHGDEARSKTPDYIIMTEISRYGNDAKSAVGGIMGGIEQNNNPGLTIVQESTSAGFDTYWQPSHERFTDMVEWLSKKHGIRATHEEDIRGETTALKLLEAGLWPDDWFHIFIPWFWNVQNRVHLEAEQEEDLRERLTDYDRQIMDQFNLDMEQIAYYVNKREVNFEGDHNMTRQEYPCTAEESFIASGNPVFNTMKIEEERTNVIRLPIVTESADIQLINQKKEKPDNRLVTFSLNYKVAPEEIKPGVYRKKFQAEVNALAIPDLGGDWWLFVPPDRDWKYRYVLGVDPATGLETGDDDAVVVYDRVTQRFVAMLVGRYGVDFLPEQVAMMATYYNFAQVLVENNNNGEGVILRLNQIYPYVMIPTKTRKGVDEYTPTSHYGIKTTPPTKARVIGNLKSFLNDIKPNREEPTIPFDQILTQMRSFVAKGDKLEAEGTKKDDLVMATAIALEAARILDFAGLMPKQVVPKEASPTILTSVGSDRVFGTPPSTRCY